MKANGASYSSQFASVAGLALLDLTRGLSGILHFKLSLTSSGFEQYFALASSISDQVLGEKQRTASVPCKPANPTQADDACARQFIESYC